MGDLDAERKQLLHQIGDTLHEKCTGEKAFFGTSPIAIRSFRATCGPRSGMLTVETPRDTDRLRAILKKQDSANLRGLFGDGWFSGGDDIKPALSWEGRNLCISATWPKHLQTTILPFADVRQRPGHGRSFTIGRDMRNSDVTVTLRGVGTHVLIGGITGSGKTCTIYTIVRQLTLNEDAQFVLINGKRMKGLGVINGLRGQVGPMATDVTTARDALAWCLQVLYTRADNPDEKYPPLFIVFDEFDVFTMADATIAQMLFLLVKMGRESNVFLICATQEPKQKMFGNNGTRGQFGTRIALLVDNRFASEAILGTTEPRADHLSGSGDAQVYAETRFTRTLIAYTDKGAARRLGGGIPKLSRWPAYNADILENNQRGPQAKPFTIEESVIGLRAVLEDRGRPWINQALNDNLGYGMGADRIDKKLRPHAEELARLWHKLD